MSYEELQLNQNNKPTHIRVIKVDNDYYQMIIIKLYLLDWRLYDDSLIPFRQMFITKFVFRTCHGTL